MLVPTVVSPSSRKSAIALQVAFSIKATRKGVPRTGSVPLPAAIAVFVELTIVVASNEAPVTTPS